MSYLEIANSTGMWLVCSVIIFVVIFQAAVFMRKAYKTGKEMGLSDEQMQSAMRSGAISTVGPSLAVVVAILMMSALLLHQYGPVRWEPAAGF